MPSILCDGQLRRNSREERERMEEEGRRAVCRDSEGGGMLRKPEEMNVCTCMHTRAHTDTQTHTHTLCDLIKDLLFKINVLVSLLFLPWEE
jgi:hypothetical protein